MAIKDAEEYAALCPAWDKLCVCVCVSVSVVCVCMCLCV